jgi:hypothetical protein
MYKHLYYYTPTHRVGAILQSPCPSVRSHFRNRYLSFYWKKWFYIWYMALAWWLVPCLPFPSLPHIYFLFTVRLRIFHVCHNENFRNSYLSFYWKKWFYIWYMALAWWLVPCLPFPGLPHIYFLFTVRLRIFHVCRNENFRNSYLSFYWKKWFYIWYMALAWWLVQCLPFPGLPHIYFLFTNERVGVFFARRSVQHLVSKYNRLYMNLFRIMNIKRVNRCFVYICKQGR